MSDSLPYQQAFQLKQEAKQLAGTGRYAEAAQLYKQAYDLCPDRYGAAGYISCSRKCGIAEARAAALFAREVMSSFANDTYFKREYVWAIYSGYLKNSSDDDVENHEELDDPIQDDEVIVANFALMENAARRILDLTSSTSPQEQETFAMCRRLAVFAICKEAKRLKKWELVLWFTQQLDTRDLSIDRKELHGRNLPSDYQRWSFSITRAYLELGRYDECVTYAHEAIEKFPDDSLHFQRWEALAKIRSGKVEEGLIQLEYINMRFPKQWYIQNDVAKTHMQLAHYNDALLWFCMAASAPGDIKGRIAMLSSLVEVLQKLERWKAVYGHLQLIWSIEATLCNQKRVERTHQHLAGLIKLHADQLSLSRYEVGNEAPSLPVALKPCRTFWQEIISSSHPHSTGRIVFVDEQKRFGFIMNEQAKFHFKWSAFMGRGRPEIDMDVEFEYEESFDHKHNQKGYTAFNIRRVL